MLRQLDAVQAILQQSAVSGRIADQNRAQQPFLILTNHQAFIDFTGTVLIGIHHRALGPGVRITDASHIDAHQL